MSLFSKTLPVAAVLWLLAGCGFEPLYGSRGPTSRVESALSEIRIEPIEDRAGQQLYNHLLDRLNPRGAPGHPRYILATTVTISKAELGIERDETATRAKLSLSASFSLRDMANNAVVYSGSSQSTNSFNIVVSDFATLSAEKDAIDRAARVVSNEIKSRLALFLNRIGGARP